MFKVASSLSSVCRACFFLFLTVVYLCLFFSISLHRPVAPQAGEWFLEEGLGTSRPSCVQHRWTCGTLCAPCPQHWNSTGEGPTREGVWQGSLAGRGWPSVGKRCWWCDGRRSADSGRAPWEGRRGSTRHRASRSRIVSVGQTINYCPAQ